MRSIKALFVIAGLAVLAGACSVLMPQQTFVVTTPEPGAEVYMALSGRSALHVSAPGLSTSIPTGTGHTGYTYIGTTPLSHTFQLNDYGPSASAAGLGSASQTTQYTEAVVRVIYPDGSGEERRVRLNHGQMRIDFGGPKPH